MSTIRVVWGSATGPTPVAAYDAALAEAGVHDYNLSTVSSVVPPDASVERAGTAPDLGPPGNRLTVVQAKATAAGPGYAVAGLGWVESAEGPGLFYEATGHGDPADLAAEIREGLEAGASLRDWRFGDEDVETVATRAEAGEHACAVVLGAYGESESIL